MNQLSETPKEASYAKQLGTGCLITIIIAIVVFVITLFTYQKKEDNKEAPKKEVGQ